MMLWTDEKLEKLRELVSQKLRPLQIARELGTTKNAVIGKCHRIGLQFFHRGIERIQVAPPKLPSQKSKAKGTGISTGKRFMINAKAKSEGKYLKVTVPADCPPSLNVPFIDNYGCSDITDPINNTCCGHELEDGKPYCYYHSKLYSLGIPNRKRHHDSKNNPR